MRALTTILLITTLCACKHPLAIVGKGDIIELNGTGRGCTLEQFTAGDNACIENEVMGEYIVNYRAIPKDGWRFVGWEGPCGHLSVAPDCRIESPALWVEYWDANLSDIPIPATTAIFAPVEDTDNDGIPDDIDVCLFGDPVFDGTIQYPLDGDLLPAGYDCGAAEMSGGTGTFASDESRQFLLFGEEDLLTFPTSLNASVFAEDSFEIQLAFKTYADAELPDYQILFSSSTGRGEPGIALIIHGEAWGSQLIVTYNDGEGSSDWREQFDAIDRGSWHEVTLVFDLRLRRWHLLQDGEEVLGEFPEAFDVEAFRALLITLPIRSGAFRDEKFSGYTDEFEIDYLNIGAPSEFILQTDADRDGVQNEEDAFPNDPAEWLDSDGDGIGNNEDEDDDNDGTLDVDDEFPTNPNLVNQASRTPAPDAPGGSDLSFDVAWSPSRVGECIPYVSASPSTVVVTEGLVDSPLDRTVYEPAVAFTDETFTILSKRDTSGGTIVNDSHTASFAVNGEPGWPVLYDDGTHGDVRANDGIYTRACLSLPPDHQPGREAYGYGGDMFWIDESLRGTETVDDVIPGVRINDAGFFISLGDAYRSDYERHWLIFNPQNCVACQYAWHVAGDIFDFFVMNAREARFGFGYTRVHDFIEGTGHNPPYPNFSHWNGPMIDGKEHTEYMGMIWTGWPLGGGMTHELGHGLLGINTQDFPAPGDRQWNSGDGAHIDSDTTVLGDLQGPVWDPDRGWPYPVRLDDGSENEWEMATVYLDTNEEGRIYLRPEDDHRFVWSDIFLYMMGLINAEDSDKTYHKLVNVAYGDCESTEFNYVCRNDSVIADEYYEFSIADMVERYGPWRSNHPNYDPTELKIGILNVSDRRHTEAEITLHSRNMRQHIEPERIRTDYSGEFTWQWSTRGLSKIKIDFTEALLPPNGE